MKILIVSYNFPPYNAIGAVRVGKTASYLHRFGHDVRVITAGDQPLQANLPIELPPEHVIATDWLNVNAPAERLLGGRDRVASSGYGRAANGTSLLGRAGQLYKTFLHVPDAQIGWLRPALRAARVLLAQWRPDVILASSPPPTALIVAERLAQEARVPWVADLRDLWTDGPYYGFPAWRRVLENRYEQRLLRTSAGLITVSEPLRARLAELYDRPTISVLNGFDPADYPREERTAQRSADAPFDIVYTGMLYSGRRDPSPLFRAIAMTSAPDRFRVRFFGRYVREADAIARACGVGHLVETSDAVPYSESLRLQRQADALLLLPGNEPAARAAYTGKFFEYLGARRPMVVISDDENVAADVVLRRGFGIVGNEPAALAAALDEWLVEHRAGRRLPDLQEEEVAEFTRESQVLKLAGFLESTCAVRCS